eukprot:scaffold56665_cov35-Tisochrysis_lutea.AAC.3
MVQKPAAPDVVLSVSSSRASRPEPAQARAMAPAESRWRSSVPRSERAASAKTPVPIRSR